MTVPCSPFTVPLLMDLLTLRGFGGCTGNWSSTKHIIDFDLECRSGPVFQLSRVIDLELMRNLLGELE